ncbi:MAG: hypothetical protein WCY71_10720 [Halothiobacillaceae bacterium]|jgi:hypothetical protein
MLIKNPYTLEETLQRLQHYLTAIKASDALALLAKAVAKASDEPRFAEKLEHAFLHGSTIECRDLFSAFGDYWAPPRAEFPYYPHSDAVNTVDSALYHIKLGDEQDAISFYNGLHNCDGAHLSS